MSQCQASDGKYCLTKLRYNAPKVIACADAGMRAGSVVQYKHLLNDAIRPSCHQLDRVMMVDHGLIPLNPVAERDVDYACSWALRRGPRERFMRLLPKTRSGKLLHRAIAALCEGRDPDDVTMLDDPTALQQVRDLMQSA